MRLGRGHHLPAVAKRIDLVRLARQQLHHQPPFMATEIDNILSDAMLTPELSPADLSAPESPPERPLCIGLVSTQPPRTVPLVSHLIPLTPRWGARGIYTFLLSLEGENRVFRLSHEQFFNPRPNRERAGVRVCHVMYCVYLRLHPASERRLDRDRFPEDREGPREACTAPPYASVGRPW